MAIKPIGDRLVVEIVKDEVEKVGSLYVPDTAKEKPNQGKVVSVGDGKKTESGAVLPLSVKAGDVVLFGKYAGTEVEHGGKTYLILQESDVLGIIA